MSENAWRNHIRLHAGFAGFDRDLMYHTYDSRRSDPGFPDDVLMTKDRRRLLFIEAKRQDGALSHEQVIWLDALAVFRDAGATNLEVYGGIRPLDRDAVVATLYDDPTATERLHQWCLAQDCERCMTERQGAKPPRALRQVKRGSGKRERKATPRGIPQV